VLAALAFMHMVALHESGGSNNPLGVSANYDRLPFAPYFIFKDLITIFLFILVLALFVFFMPNLLGDSENYVMANPMQTPPAINIDIFGLTSPIFSMNYPDKGLIQDEINLNKENSVSQNNLLYNKQVINENQKGFMTISNKKQEVTKLELINLIESIKEKIIENNSPYLVKEAKFLNDFKELVNGVFQAEGHIGGYFPSASTITFRPLIYISQNASDSSIEFFTVLWIILDKKFKFVIYQNEPSKYFHIKLLSRD